ncbi:GNAT family N-acetyltransferase [Marinomonas sp. 15G1-11]|mgnify:CR=1 FL=1|uniref:GNAT family N-acetyltransferase n=1 Tax=Marinomonas phaeophyticola TaxID=3004091 RepID=A0ABT4JSI5_9GAMM|nr:GNAT family N-acetyltransferase [Marinomonas sp. 15G1-11]MCZ2720783.1 GNAT family N-acetyltransferase [Marinomonas sp. 15G1-11]
MQPTEIDQLILDEKWSDLSDFLSPLRNTDTVAHILYAKSILTAYGKGEENNLREAISLLKTAQKIEPNSARYNTILSTMLLQSGEKDDAHLFALNACKVAYQDPTTHLALARSFLAQNKELKAYESFQQALSFVPDSQPEFKEDIKRNILKLSIIWDTPLIGKRLTLRRASDEDFDFLLAIRKNDTFRNQYNMFHGTSVKLIKDSLTKSQKKPIESGKVEWIIEKNSIPIGIASLVDINTLNSRAELLIGFPHERSGWVSLEATFLILEFAFQKLKLNKIYSYVYSDNTYSQKNTLHLGFTQEGILRSHVKRPGTSKYLDLIVNGYLANEFFQSQKISVLFRRVLGRKPSIDPF